MNASLCWHVNHVFHVWAKLTENTTLQFATSTCKFVAILKIFYRRLPKGSCTLLFKCRILQKNIAKSEEVLALIGIRCIINFDLWRLCKSWWGRTMPLSAWMAGTYTRVKIPVVCESVPWRRAMMDVLIRRVFMRRWRRLMWDYVDKRPWYWPPVYTATRQNPTQFVVEWCKDDRWPSAYSTRASTRCTGKNEPSKIVH